MKTISMLWLSMAVISLILAVVIGEIAIRTAAFFLPDVKYLATAGMNLDKAKFESLDGYLAAQNLIPYRSWRNYRSNSLGFYDTQFSAPKPEGRLRVMALGDSFIYGMAPYPKNVLTVTEKTIRDRCPENDFELFNFGIPEAGVWDYRKLGELAGPVYDPDIVVVHFYMGNDGPDLFYHSMDLPQPGFRIRSYLLDFVNNALKLLRGLDAQALRRTLERPPQDGVKGEAPVGGEVVDPSFEFTDERPALKGPTFTKEKFISISAGEMMRLYNSGEQVEKDWAPILAELDSIRKSVESRHASMVIVMYPSALQVYPDMRRNLFERMITKERYKNLGLELWRFDPQLPNKMLSGYCKDAGIECFDITPDLVKASREQGKFLYTKRDTHWNILGNQEAAKAEAGFLENIICPSSN
ncbi:hypothetical protein MNBD_NITROSPINAE03-827 [hydrothermal vent metagenome]|uniref:AlgX/AlgJ SGNH hydrolase-like domain-containing protein n=1 Tax=hydrothermal vent metagenome TaxID=652676 RepID=A0A3B1CLM9_9ZZZZ